MNTSGINLEKIARPFENFSLVLGHHIDNYYLFIYSQIHLSFIIIYMKEVKKGFITVI